MKLQRQGKTSATVVGIGENEILYSYTTPVAALVPGQGYLRTNKYYSKTTSGHINKWLVGVLASVVSQAEIDRIANGGKA